jgi:hypothetical protein
MVVCGSGRDDSDPYSLSRNEVQKRTAQLPRVGVYCMRPFTHKVSPPKLVKTLKPLTVSTDGQFPSGSSWRDLISHPRPSYALVVVETGYAQGPSQLHNLSPPASSNSSDTHKALTIRRSKRIPTRQPTRTRPTQHHPPHLPNPHHDLPIPHDSLAQRG